MKLIRLSLSGFKSFATSVDFHYDSGVTAIVGPNGCGKSNVSDAVRWVLGEQRSRLLRGQRMEDVIFHGSAKRRPVNIAEVTLAFDNSDGTLPVAYSTVEITRRLSRSGQSEYLINQTPVRLRDVQDLLRGTGLGSEAGVVMEAGMIDRLLSDRAEERRSLFDEAAGIGLYRDRKETTQRRLDRTTEDLTRLDDIIAEVRTQVRSLARQRGKAERHRQYTQEKLGIVVTLARHDLAEIDRRRGELRRAREELLRALPEAERALSLAEQDRAARVESRASSEARRAEVERRLAAARVEVERLEGDLRLAAERLENAAARLVRARAERDQARERAQQLARERAAAAQERQAAEQARRSVQMELDLRAAGEEEVRARLAEQRQKVRDLEGALQAETERLHALQAEKGLVERELADLATQEQELTKRLRELEAMRQRAREREADARGALSERERERHDASVELERTRHAVAAARENEAALRVERRASLERLAQLEVRQGALAELEREREGLAPAAKELLRDREQIGHDLILGPLSDFITAIGSRARLAERLLGDWVHAVLVKDREAVERVKSWHRERKPGPLVLLPVEPGPAGIALSAAIPEGLEVREPAVRWVAALIGGDLPADPEGACIERSNGSVWLGDGSSGLLSRRAELLEVTRELEEQREAAAGLERRLHDAVARLAEAERQLAAALARSERAQQAAREAQAAREDAARELARLERDFGELDGALSRLRDRRAACSARLEAIGEALARSAEEKSRLEEELRVQRENLSQLDSAQEAAREKRVRWQVEEAQVSAREQAAREREERAARELAEAEAAIERLEAELKELEKEQEHLRASRAEWEDQLAEHRTEVTQLAAAAEEAGRALEMSEEALAQSEAALERARQRVSELKEEGHRLDLAEQEIEGRRRALAERIEAEWRKPLDQLLESVPEVEGDPELLREEVERLTQAIEALGPVNPLAVEEHAEELKRLEFLTAQREDLVRARDSLLQAIREIDETARSMFTDTFSRIRENFKVVFRTLFEGGECDLRLVDESDPLGSDIEIWAAPRGKRTQRIHLLSSGERTLVAISLLFAIYLTKPSPFCLLDEVDAPLDDANVARFVRLLSEFKHQTQFIVITHNPRTMQAADAVYGVTMQEPGVSTIVGVRLGAAEPV
ncbi:Chromosome partition protein Smc [bacterium HR33]|nr:Chromosome partition protein Smc [bacterium HR33]